MAVGILLMAFSFGVPVALVAWVAYQPIRTRLSAPLGPGDVPWNIQDMDDAELHTQLRKHGVKCYIHDRRKSLARTQMSYAVYELSGALRATELRIVRSNLDNARQGLAEIAEERGSR